MIGWVYVMEPQRLSGMAERRHAPGSLAENGEKLFENLACSNCHKPDGSGRCPTLVGLFGKDVQLADGATVKADEAYIRESILQPDGQDGGRLSAADAHLPGPGHRGGRTAIGGIHQVAGAQPAAAPAASECHGAGSQQPLEI